MSESFSYVREKNEGRIHFNEEENVSHDGRLDAHEEEARFNEGKLFSDDGENVLREGKRSRFEPQITQSRGITQISHCCQPTRRIEKSVQSF